MYYITVLYNRKLYADVLFGPLRHGICVLKICLLSMSKFQVSPSLLSSNLKHEAFFGCIAYSVRKWKISLYYSITIATKTTFLLDGNKITKNIYGYKLKRLDKTSISYSTR